MIVSSRTPEGEPLECPVCGQRTPLELSIPGGDACCVRCGHLLDGIRDRVLLCLGRTLASFPRNARLRHDLGLDSTDQFELLLELNELDPRFEGALMDENVTISDLFRAIPPPK